MVAQDPAASPTRTEQQRATSIGATSRVLCLAAAVAAVSACSQALPAGPNAGPFTIRGQIYQQGTASGEPLLGDVLVTVREAEGTLLTVLSNHEGLYTMSVRAGWITITVWKAGYMSKVSALDLAEETTWNFSLSPE